ncbi:tetratricopeptide repeat protein [Amycolatopsis pithecellobii]|uniref:Tetratricopeptide repeat protein n=1 Tax=Amycolatopsis pithecellobii TaxID=664692 RepID=A0A6N7YTY9_9PSEU|nr:tetratricopeptide repeat protein [Amycolatopsis pithecellobii]MTD55398.1 tetratricopeptide repeat protein [Amycolatopsis pithecellobii]
MELERQWPAMLPDPVRLLVGRTREARLLDELAGTETVAVTGPRGAGKTALISWWATRAEHRFPGGCLYADLNGTAGHTEAILAGFLRRLGVSHTSTAPAELPGLFRLVTENRRILVVLDNAVSAAQVHALRPGPGNGIVVTSRDALPGFAGTTLALGPLSIEECQRLLSTVAGADRVAGDPEATQRVIHLCARLPLPLRLAGDQLAARENLTMARLAEELDAGGATTRVRRPIDAGVSVAMDAGYRTLSPEAAKTFRLLGSQPCGALHLFAITALTDLGVPSTKDAVDELVRCGLVERTGKRYRTAGPVGEYPSEPELAAARRRLLRWYAAMTYVASDALAPDWAGAAMKIDTTGLTLPEFSGTDYRAPLSWLDNEFPAAVALLHATKTEISQAWQLPVLYLPYLYLTKRWQSCLDFAGTAVKIADASGSAVARARSLHAFSWVLHELNRDEEALPHLREARKLHEGIDDARGSALTAHMHGEVLTALGFYPDARERLDDALGHFRQSGWRFGTAIALASKAATLEKEGWPALAFEAAREALAISGELRIWPLEGRSHHQLALLHQRNNEPHAAAVHFTKAIELRRATGEHWGEADSLLSLAEVLAGTGKHAEARDALQQSRRIFTELHDPQTLVVDAALTNLDVSRKPADGRES